MNNTITLMILTVISSFFMSSELMGSQPGTVQASKKRFIISHFDSDQLMEGVKTTGIEVIKEMKYHKGVVVIAEEDKVKKLANTLEGTYEEDYPQFIVGRDTLGSRKGPAPQPQPSQTVPWGIRAIGALETHPETKGMGVIVCVSDTGIDLDHPDLQNNIISNYNAITSRKSGDDDNGHGTHVAGIIAGLDNTIGIIGVAPQAKLIAAKGLDRNGSGYSSDLAETIDECRIRGAKVINMSWGSSQPSSIIHDALVRADGVKILLIAASGNEAGPVIYPAAFPEVVAVSAIDSNNQFAPFSNFGIEVENSAPGVAVLSTYKNGTYKSLNGTSMASPHVAGVAALVLSVLPSATRDNLLGLDIGLLLEQQGSRGRIDAVLSTQ